MRETDAEFEQRIIDNVDRHGCSINAVSDPEGGDPPFAYSIGFPKSVGQPEVIVFGLPIELMKWMINETRRQCADEGLVLFDGQTVGGLLDGFDCVLLEIPGDTIDREYFNSAIWYRHEVMGEEMDRAFQIFWPGSQDGLFPWEKDADAHVTALQSTLLKVLQT